VSVYLAVLDAVNLKTQDMGLMSAKKVEAFCTLSVSGWDGCGNTANGSHEITTEVTKRNELSCTELSLY
jgi:hypothetical protein